MICIGKTKCTSEKGLLQSVLFDLQIAKPGEKIDFSLFCVTLNLYVRMISLPAVVRQLNGACYIFKQISLLILQV